MNLEDNVVLDYKRGKENCFMVYFTVVKNKMIYFF